MLTWQIDQQPTNLPSVFTFTVWKHIVRPWGLVPIFLDHGGEIQYSNVHPSTVFGSKLQAAEAINAYESQLFNEEE